MTQAKIFNLSWFSVILFAVKGHVYDDLFSCRDQIKMNDIFNYCPASIPTLLFPLFTECPFLFHSCSAWLYNMLWQWTITELMQTEALNVPVFFGLPVMLQSSLWEDDLIAVPSEWALGCMHMKQTNLTWVWGKAEPSTDQLNMVHL